MTSTHKHHNHYAPPPQNNQNDFKLPSLRDLNFYRPPGQQDQLPSNPQPDYASPPPPTTATATRHTIQPPSTWQRPHQQQQQPVHHPSQSHLPQQHQQHTPPLSTAHDSQRVEYTQRHENTTYAHPGIPLSAQTTPIPGSITSRTDDSPNHLKRRTAPNGVPTSREGRTPVNYSNQYLSYQQVSQSTASTPYSTITSGLSAQPTQQTTTPAVQPPQTQSSPDQLQYSSIPVNYNSHQQYISRPPVIHQTNIVSQQNTSNPYPSSAPPPPPPASTPQGPWPTQHQQPPPPSQPSQPTQQHHHHQQPPQQPQQQQHVQQHSQHQQQQQQQHQPTHPSQQHVPSHQQQQPQQAPPTPYQQQQQHPPPSQTPQQQPQQHVPLPQHHPAQPPPPQHYQPQPQHHQSAPPQHQQQAPLPPPAVQQQPQPQQIPYARTSAIIPANVDTRPPQSYSVPPESQGGNDTMSEITTHCSVLYQFATRWVHMQTNSPQSQPSHSELKEMSDRAMQVVRLLEQLRATTNTQESEQVRISQDVVMQGSPDSARPPKRPWEDISEDDPASVSDQNGFNDSPPQQQQQPVQQQQYSEPKNQTTAEQDMELIRTKRATSTAGANGNTGQQKSKYRKRSRATPPGKCHSCNIRETPEWRRGPDGARTLCNACGLHYAKLMRKRDKAGPNGETPHIDLETLRASARAAETADKASRSNKQSSSRSHQPEPASPMDSVKQAPQHHQGSFQLVNMMTPDPTSSSSIQTPQQQPAQISPPQHQQQPQPPQPQQPQQPQQPPSNMPPHTTWAPAPPPGRMYPQSDIQHQSFMRTPQR